MSKRSKRASAETAIITEGKVTIKTEKKSTRNAVATKTEIELEENVISMTKTKRKISSIKKEEQDGKDDHLDAKPAAKKRRTKAEKEAEENMILAPRTATTSLKRAMFVGAHVSAAGGVQNAVPNASKIGANAFALFLKSQRKWESPPLAASARDGFAVRLAEHDYDPGKHVLPHGSYLINLAQTDRARADRAYDGFVDDLRRCEALGVRLYNFHPGSTGGEPMGDAVGRIAAQLNRAHRETGSAVTVLECMCGSKNVVGSRFEELRDIIALVEDKSRVGVCIDTCHIFAAGYDLRAPEAFAKTMGEFAEIVGLKYLRALHLNDSKAPLASHRDLHANIGTGFLGLRAFHNVMNYEPFQHLPMVLETPIEVKGPDGKTTEDKQVWADEIKLLESLIGMDLTGPGFRAKEKELQAKGASERKKIQEQVDKKAEKDAKKAERDAKKGVTGVESRAGKKKKRKADESSCDSCGESD